MGLFRSEEHVKNWVDYDLAAEEAIMPVANWAQCFAIPACRTRLEPDTLTRQQSFGDELLGVLANFGLTGPRWLDA
jgi:hypothetical protein